jgi:hypothetical protein
VTSPCDALPLLLPLTVSFEFSRLAEKRPQQRRQSP